MHRRSPTATRPHSRLPRGFAKIIDLFTETHARAVGSKKAPAAPANALLACMIMNMNMTFILMIILMIMNIAIA